MYRAVQVMFLPKANCTLCIVPLAVTEAVCVAHPLHIECRRHGACGIVQAPLHENYCWERSLAYQIGHLANLLHLAQSAPKVAKNHHTYISYEATYHNI